MADVCVVSVRVSESTAKTQFHLTDCRATAAFPIRKLPIDCFDPDINRTLLDGSKTMYLFAYAAEVPYVAVVVISFFLPPVVVSHS